MKLHFRGAAADVTGAAFQLITRDASVLVDCGRRIESEHGIRARCPALGDVIEV
jgi:predicted metal-dependent RNase